MFAELLENRGGARSGNAGKHRERHRVVKGHAVLPAATTAGDPPWKKAKGPRPPLPQQQRARPLCPHYRPKVSHGDHETAVTGSVAPYQNRHHPIDLERETSAHQRYEHCSPTSE